LLAGDRFDCHACGFCCSSGHDLGPITEADRARILAVEWVGVLPGVRGPEDLFREAGRDRAGRPRLLLAQRSGRCVFLDDENLCAVHKRLGRDAKPHMCRLFPFAITEAPDGTYVTTRRECASLERSRRSGTPLEDQREELSRLAIEESAPQVVPERVPFMGPLAVPYELARAIRDAALHALEAKGRPDAGASDAAAEGASEGAHPLDLWARMAAVRDLAAGVSARLGERPGPTEEAAALSFAEGRASGDGPPAPAPVSDALAADARAALASLVSEWLDISMKHALYLRFEAADAGDLRRGAQDALSLALLEVLAALAPTLSRPLAGLPPIAAAERRARIALDPSDGAEAAGALRDALRAQVHGYAFAARAPLLMGLALAPLRIAVAVAHARRTAWARGADAVSAEDAHEGLLLATSALEGAAFERAALRDPRRLLTYFRGFASCDVG